MKHPFCQADFRQAESPGRQQRHPGRAGRLKRAQRREGVKPRQLPRAAPIFENIPLETMQFGHTKNSFPDCGVKGNGKGEQFTVRRAAPSAHLAGLPPSKRADCSPGRQKDSLFVAKAPAFSIPWRSLLSKNCFQYKRPFRACQSEPRFFFR